MAEKEGARVSGDAFQADTDQFKGVILKPEHYGSVSPAEFERRLQASLAVWREEGVRGVWIKQRCHPLALYEHEQSTGSI
jgi:hypothetical protein